MKILNFVFVCLLTLGMSFGLSAQSTLPSDTTTLPYVVDDMVTAIKDCYEQPINTNEYAHFLSNEAGFPPLQLGEPLTASHLVQLKDWVKSNPLSIEEFLIRRKKNYDTYFNPALQE
ncbi:hypothetical protein N8Z47_05150 [Salibacteraceae bacterium]|nr:hypothetical protein [Salibacteraceae bacterium]